MSVQFKRWLHRVFPRKRHQMRHLCDFACFLAKQVLSQLSYTPTAATAIDIKVFAPIRKLRIFTFHPLCVDCVKTPLPETCCVTTTDISLARRLILPSASRFICNFICEYFLKT